jgi:1,4-alpha-glucan branching enzyme
VASKQLTEVMSIQKKFLKTKPYCKVTFVQEAAQVAGAKTVSVVGAFNNWDPTAHQMQQLKTGAFKLQLDLETGKAHQFRYFIDGHLYENDEAADAYVPSGVGFQDNSVVDLTTADYMQQQ